MKKLLISMLFIAVAAFCAEAPKIEFQEESVDFGRVEKSIQVKHVFKFKNTGEAVLVIDDIVAGCSCTGTLVSDKSVQPGGTGELEVTLNTGKIETKLFKSVYVYSNDPQNGIVVLNITAYVDIDPPQKKK
ncbi:MAG: DUF1573 domain-containing protein [Spirochaetia bacterium]|jgi:hypothetical protein|nr:DUF1573 domain-containing protein [Spirochaetia bacterium]